MPEQAHATHDDHDAARRKEPAPSSSLEAYPGMDVALDSTFTDTRLLAAHGDEPNLRGSVRQRASFARSFSRVHGNQRLSRVIDSMVHRQGAPAAGGGAPVGVIPSAEALRARAQEALSNTYGFIKKIVPAKVEVVDEPTLRQRFDEMQIRKKTTNPKTGKEWEMGGSLLVFQTLDGFADRDNGTIYVPDRPGGADSQLATVIHEMLHTNAAGDWASTVGMAIDEGETEILTMKACAGQRIPITPQYASQRGTVEQLVPVAGAGTLERAYFGGVSILASAVEAVLGEGGWEKLRTAIREGDREKFDKLLRAKHTSDWAKEKIQIILGIIGQWWESDEDIARIEAICATANAEDLRAISDAITPHLSSVFDAGDRARVRIAIGN